MALALKVLVVEDDAYWQNRWRTQIGNRVMILSAYTLKEAQYLFKEHPDIAIIAMDACVPGGRPTTPPLVEWMRKEFSGPIIAMSSDPRYRKELLSVGCDHECEKGSVPSKILELLEASKEIQSQI